MRRYKECIKYVFYFLEQTFYGPLFTLYSPFVERHSSKNRIKIENCIPQNDRNVISNAGITEIYLYIIIFIKKTVMMPIIIQLRIYPLSVVILPCLQKYGNEFAGY